MFSTSFLCNFAPTPITPHPIRFKTLATLPTSTINTSLLPSQTPWNPNSSVHLDSLRFLEWHKLCDSVATFAGTPFGRESIKEQLWELDLSYEESKNLQSETTAAVEMLKYGISCMDFSVLDVVKVKSALNYASRGSSVVGNEAMAVASLLQFADSMQLSLNAAIREDKDWYNRFMPLADMIKGLVINRALIKAVHQVIDEDGVVKDSASSDLKRFRNQVRLLERKLHQLMDNFFTNESNVISSQQVTTIDGRWCVKLGTGQPATFKGLLLSGGLGAESLVEPVSIVPLNDELQQSRALVAKAEEDVLSKLTEKMRTDLVDIENSLNTLIQLDVVTARAKYSLAFGGTCPDLSFVDDKGGSYFIESSYTRKENVSKVSIPFSREREWTVHLRKAYHPLLLQQHREKLQKARKDVRTASVEKRRRLQGESLTSYDNQDLHLSSIEIQVTKLEEAHPAPVDILVTRKTKVLVITGPNTGGKTVTLKTIGLAALMAKTGLYVLAAEPVRIPWFDSIFADIGDEQSLAQSLSTFSGHLKQINGIRAQSTDNSLLLLDEVGAGTNPLEGAALGMSLLESFAECGALLTIATTHHGELKTLKYRNDRFENACVEFDEVKLKPTYKILWGIPGRSNAINIAERLGLPCSVLDMARNLYGTASAEINGVILDMERFKQDFQQDIHEAQQSLLLSRQLHENLFKAKQEITEYQLLQSQRKVREMSEIAARARSILHHKMREFRASAAQTSQNKNFNGNQISHENLKPSFSAQTFQNKTFAGNPISHENLKPSFSGKQKKIPEIGDSVYVPVIGKKVTVLKVEESKQEIVVQANNMKMRLRFSDIELK